MDGEPPLPSSSSLYAGGVGGKSRKPPSRKKPPTPYARPPSAIQHPPPPDEVWLSKLVSPAYRLIASGASRILPSFFSRSSSSSDLSSSDHDDLGLDESDYPDTEEVADASNDENHTSTLAVFKTNDEAGPSNATNMFQENSENTRRELNTQNSSDHPDMSKIEELVKGKLFSRDEISRLTEILKSKLVDNDDNDQRKEQQLLNNGGESTLSLLGTSTPHHHLKKHDEVAASPADIAKAYMGNRTSESPFSSHKAIRSKDEISSRAFIPPSSPKPSICWPGAVVPDQLPYPTPQAENAKFGLQNLPRTPYSRTIFSKSKSKLSQLQGDNKSLHISSSPFQNSRSPSYGQVNSRINGYGSVGPIRRLRNKFGSEIRPSGSSYLYSARNSPSPSKENNSTERTDTNSTSKYNSVYNESSQLNSPANETARKILERLDRPKPTPKEIEAELKIATAWKRSPDEGKMDFVAKKNIFDSDKRDSFDLRKDSNNEIGHLSFKTSTQDTIFVSKASSVVFGDANAGPSGVNKTAESNVTNTFQKIESTANNTTPKDSSQLWPYKSQPGNGHNFAKVKLPVSTKPALKNISINKLDPKHIVSSENTLSFTFPVSKTSTVLSEPPTPSIMPTFTNPQIKEREPAVPTYTFDSKKSTPRLVFSFPSTSGTAKSDGEAPDIKFKFGSDKRKRVSFSSVGKDAVCI